MESARVKSLGKYRIEDTLGVGAMGVVYRAFDPHIGRRVALKTIRNDLFERGERASLMARFRNEAQAAGRLSHPNIVAVYDYGETDGTAYLAMEYVAGSSLAAVLDGARALAVGPALDGFAQLLAALAYAHEQGIVHRDIKPANLLLNERGQLKVTDFGIAHIESSTLTVDGSVVGTPSYMAPEQFCGEPVDGRSDLYSAAVVLYQMLTGVRPFVGTPPAVMQQMLRDPPRPPSAHNPSLPAALDAVLLRALAKDRAARFQTPRALHDALAEAARGRAASGDATGSMGSMGSTDAVDAVDASGAAWRASRATATDIARARPDDDDRTVLVAQAGPSGPPTRGSRAAPGASDARPPSVWPAADLAAVEARLAAQVGPVARLLIARAAARTTDLPTLAALLLPHIPSDKGRQQFNDALATLAGTGTYGAVRADPARDGAARQAAGDDASPAAQPPRAALTPEQIHAAALQLAVFVGPIAQLIAKRAAADASDLPSLRERLAAAIRNADDRARYRRAAGLPPG